MSHTCALCQDSGFICIGLNADACPACATAAEVEYQTRQREPRQMALILQFPERIAA